MNSLTERRVLIVLTVVVVIAIVLMFAACGDTTPTPREDLSDSDVTLDTSGWRVYANFDEFPNVAVKCDGTARMYTTTRIELPLIVIPDHDLCQGGDS